MTRNDADILGESLSNNLSTGIQSLMMGTIGLSVMLYISVPVTLVAAAATPITFILTKKYGEYQKRLGRLSQDAIGEMTKVRSLPRPFKIPSLVLASRN